ncbi:erythromycin esterase family protein [Microtetraspora malaysiensis]|uniref:erythromycin esterase family protein n=1 Tax=Microtetraspora malaysiensis TaxID=161358 RepID=UPI003D92FCAC
MTSSASSERFTHTRAGQTAVLTTLDPQEPLLDDLEPLGGVVADARVVGIGEGAHFVHEFNLARARLIRYLLERHGFTHVALELGAADAVAVNPWLAGDGEETDLSRLSGPLTLGVFGELLHWLRDYNRGRSRPVQVIGIDLPNTLTLRPDLDPVAEYLRLVDPDAGDLVAGVLRTADEITGGSAAVSAPQWGRLDPAVRDTLTAGLARLSLRLRALEPLYVSRSDQQRYDTARRHLDAACHTDYMLQAMNNLFSGAGLPADTSVRDRFMATCVHWHLARAGVGARVVLVAHNNHIQKTPVTFGGHLAGLPMGHYLARELGPHYRAVAVTHTAGEVPEMSVPAEGSPVGFAVEPVRLDAPEPGSVERALIDAGLGEVVTVTDLRHPDPVTASPDRIRSQSAMVDAPLHQAFDAVVCTPTATLDAAVDF